MFLGYVKSKLTPFLNLHEIAWERLFPRNDTLTSNSFQTVALTSPKERGEPADKSFPSPSGRGIKGEGTPPAWWRGIKGEGKLVSPPPYPPPSRGRRIKEVSKRTERIEKKFKQTELDM